MWKVRWFVWSTKVSVAFWAAAARVAASVAAAVAFWVAAVAWVVASLALAIDAPISVEGKPF